MILQALKAYYDRKATDPESDIAPEGFEKKEIPFIVVITADGELVNLKPTREKLSNRITKKSFLLPRSEIRAGSKSYEKTFLLWDHIGYLFGHPESDPKAAKQHQTWLNSLKNLPEVLKKDEGVNAVLLFYERNGIEAVKNHAMWSECLRISSCNMTFALVEDLVPVPCRHTIQDYVRASVQMPNEKNDKDETLKILGQCLITGEFGEIARTHYRTPIDKDTKSLVSFQRNSGYDSYGKEQCYNAPISKSAEFAYTTGLNTLLKSKRQRIKVGNALTVFWSEKDSSLENDAFFFFSDPPKDDPDRNTEAMRIIYDSVWSGNYIVPDDNTRFYALGLSPNVARISVRFWQVGTVKEMGVRLKQHIDDLAITHSSNTDKALPMWRLLRSIAANERDENIPPNLAGEIMRSILEGLPYPATLLQAAIRRIRSGQAKRDRKAQTNVTYERAALIKAFLNRSLRFNNPQNEKEITMFLDQGNTNIGYRLGRLFAVLEKIQTDANPGLNATIRDRFYGAASSTPVIVFANLMRLSNHHLSKLEKKKLGLSIMYKQLLSEIMSAINDFPAHLVLADQGRFAIGYYHQVQDLWSKKQ